MKGCGNGSITPLRNGRFWVRAPEQDGQRKGLGTFATREEAEDHLNTFLALLDRRDEVAPRGISFAKFARAVLDQREGDGFRGVDKDRGRLEHHLVKSPIGGMSIADIRPAHGAELARWLGKQWASDKRGRRKIKRTTVLAIFNVASVVMNEAVFREMIPSNPLAGIEIRKRADEDSADTWTYLTLDEQRAFATCEKIPPDVRLIVRFAIGSGIREGELHHNLLRDLHVGENEKRPRLVVRYGSAGKAPKNGKIRTVDIFGDALFAIREWLEMRKTYMRKSARHEVQKDIGLIFPTVTGCRRQEAKTFGNGWADKETGAWVDRFKHYCALAGIQERPGLYFHCLRHTCATSLLQGVWGRDWALEEVQEQLGHSSISVTQRYAHKTGTRVQRAAQETNEASGYRLVTGGVRDALSSNVTYENHRGAATGIRTPDLCFTKALLSPNNIAPLDGKYPPETGVRNHLRVIAELAASYRELVARGQHVAASAVAASLADALAANP